MKTGKINAELKAKIDSLQKAIDSYTNCLILPCFDDDVEFFTNRITGLVEQKAELVKGI
ncbi:MAG TPA: hypothetical protein VMW44_00975 [Candidatus Bathyarchaeia archaeon]|nr:hypothetical protein [Candidatus Bathyarchaeia archaeon]